MERNGTLVQLALAGGVLLFTAGAALLVFSAVKSHPGVIFLEEDGGAHWIRGDVPRRPLAYPARPHTTLYRTAFETRRAVLRPVLELRALASATVELDGVIVHREPRGPEDDRWRRKRSIELTPRLAPGRHTLAVLVEGRRTPSLLWAHSQALGVDTGNGWDASWDAVKWKPVRIVRDGPPPLAVSREFPHAGSALLGLLPVLLPLFLLVVAADLAVRRSRGEGPLARLRISASQLRWLLLGAWGALAVNNIGKIPEYVGMDVVLHMDYVRHLVNERSLPLATQGGEMMQAPLSYLLLAPLYALFTPTFAEGTVVKLLRVLPLACGLLQVELCYRAARVVYPKREDLQKIGTLVGGLLPVNLYMAQAVANEPLTALLGGAAIAMTFGVLMRRDEPGRRRLAWIGVLLGAAMLSKVSALLLVLPVLAAVAFRCAGSDRSPRSAASGASVVALGVVLVAGWYYLRNTLLMGAPVVGIFTTEGRTAWWQEPGFRTVDQYLRFGEALAYPVYAAVVGIWDGLYASLWTDGLLSGIAVRAMEPPWNYSFMLAGAQLALLPSAAIALGSLRAFSPRGAESDGSAATGPDVRVALLFALACVVAYVAALVIVNLRIPFYCVAKASYLCATTPCLAVLAAGGFDRLTSVPVLRSAVLGGLTCWAVSAFAAYFVL
ncbi:MAG: hypothetical protein ACE5FL_02640 [Myxococcota bacterium]